MRIFKIITIDGPASSGKTTISRLLAKKLNYLLLESGSLYRLVTYLLLSTSDLKNYLKDSQKLLKFLEDMFKEIEIKLLSEGTFIYWKERLIKEELRSKDVENVVSKVAALKEVRDFLTNFMRKLAENKSIVAEGRDMGSVVFPYADLKIFLTASDEVRARRRFKEKLNKESNCKYEEVLENIKFRDELDSKRAVAPLTVPDSAYVIDTSYLTPEQVLNEILKLIEK
ncbi:(d)CMP kinase [Thermodesulfobacterium hydrogeniphilum]|uniref:(d)CMP kinase n=1 Tax=Thermodesulfobacterium hydrogeniphilum TaxID=161156 RepID=UPI00056F0D37|nr:(d)CMP kinase [Thermodesulfobacterium hydrogeniphilum]